MKKIIFFLCALALLPSCTTLIRSVKYWSADIDDYKIFPKYEFKQNNEVFFFNKKANPKIDSLKLNFKRRDTLYNNLIPLLKTTSTRAFIIIKNDSIIFEKYFNGYTKEDISCIFSISKSITSLLVGIAIDEGYISSVDDPITKYVKELNSSDPLFKKLTIKHLLDMRSGIKFKESYQNPLAKMTQLYYGTNQLRKIKRMYFKSEPGSKYEYQSVSTAILGLVIEKATKQSFAKYFEEKVWEPLNMENYASWSLDDRKNQSAKSYCGLNISAIDVAKIGRLYLNKGNFNGKQIVSEKWIMETLTPNMQNFGYQNQWYSFQAYGTDTSGHKYFNDSLKAEKIWEENYSKKYPYYNVIKVVKNDFKKSYRKNLWDGAPAYKWQLNICTGEFYALGIMKQILFIDPKKNIIIVRLGDYGDLDYVDLMWKIAHEL